jgi:hypothetical protein
LLHALLYNPAVTPYLPNPIRHSPFAIRQIPMRAEIEHLVDETKQSVGLLRRHL